MGGSGKVHRLSLPAKSLAASRPTLLSQASHERGGTGIIQTSVPGQYLGLLYMTIMHVLPCHSLMTSELLDYDQTTRGVTTTL